MGEIFERFGIKVKIEDTTNDNPREAEHFHYYYEGYRFKIFFKDNRESYEFDPKQNHPRKARKFLEEHLPKNMENISKEYENALNGRRVNKIKLK